MGKAQVAMAARLVLFLWSFHTKSFVKHSMGNVLLACVHSPDLQNRRGPRQILDINMFHCLQNLRDKKKPVPLPLEHDYVNLKNQIIKAERRVLKELGFCVHVKHPHKVGLRPSTPRAPSHYSILPEAENAGEDWMSLIWFPFTSVIRE